LKALRCDEYQGYYFRALYWLQTYLDCYWNRNWIGPLRVTLDAIDGTRCYIMYAIDGTRTHIWMPSIADSGEAGPPFRPMPGQRSDHAGPLGKTRRTALSL